MLKILRRIAIGLGCLALAAALFVAVAMRLSLPDEDGVHELPGLGARVDIEFDAHGVPRIRAVDRNDAFAALGYASARDRLFQMDLNRRFAQGRMAEILGLMGLKSDLHTRRLGLSRLPEVIFDRLPEDQRAALVAYSAGANRAWEEMGTPPLEFLLLAYRPEPWRPQDSVAVMLGLAAQYSYKGNQERMASVLRRALPPKVVEFLTPEADCYNEILAPRDPARCTAEAAPLDEIEALLRQSHSARLSGLVAPPEATPGSNGWVVGGQKTRDGRAILANDMHLGLQAPSIWYRAELEYGVVRLKGLTIPGLPLVVSGGNGHIAWGFTSVEGDFSDLVRIEPDPADPGRYRTPEGSAPFALRAESIVVRGGETRVEQIRETIWGPVLADKLLGDDVAVRWSALDPGSIDFELMNIDRIESVRDALPLFNRAGGPPLNVLLADSGGHIGWTLMGRLPKRFGTTGLFSESWADGARGWRGYFAPGELPSVVDPPSGFLVNTNQRMLGPKEFAPEIGHDYSGAFRAWRVTQRLRELSRVTESDMLAVQLDTTTDVYRYYQALALRALKDGGDAGTREAKELRRYVEAWDGRAEIDSLGLPLLVVFRDDLIDAVFSPIVARCRELDPKFKYRWVGMDDPLRRIIDSGREGLLPDRKSHADWPHFLRAILAKSAARLAEKHGVSSLQGLSWGRVSTVQIPHPLLGPIPLLGRVFNMPTEPLAGCWHCVRFSYSAVGASARMVVSPDHESDGVLELPGGQSGQPGSRHYGDQLADWIAGLPSPFVASAGAHRLSLTPRSSEALR